MRIADLISLLGLIQGLLLGAIILYAHRPQRPTLLLGFFILTLALRIVPFLLLRHTSGEVHAEVRWLPLYFWYLSLPLLFLYVRHLTGRINWKRDWRHLIPGGLEFGFLAILLVIAVLRPAVLVGTALGQNIFTGYLVAALVPGFIYAYLIVKLLNRSQAGITQYYSNLVGKDLRWLRISVIYLVASGAVYCFVRFGNVAISSSTVTILGAVLNTVGIYYISVNGLRQFTLPKTDHLSEPPEKEADASRPDKPPGPSQTFETVDQHVRENKSFLNPQLTLADLTESLHLSDRHLSRVINEGSGLHFNGYINRYRVQYAKELLRNEAYDHFNMEGIAAEAGFNNKATFYKAFKQYADLSPAAFRKQRTIPS